MFCHHPTQRLSCLCGHSCFTNLTSSAWLVIDAGLFLQVDVWPSVYWFSMFVFGSASCLCFYRLWSMATVDAWSWFAVSIRGYVSFFQLVWRQEKTGTFITPANGLENEALHLASLLSYYLFFLFSPLGLLPAMMVSLAIWCFWTWSSFLIIIRSC